MLDYKAFRKPLSGGYKIEKEAKEFIKAAVNLDLSKIDFMKIDMKSGQVKGIMNKIFDEAFILIETL